MSSPPVDYIELNMSNFDDEDVSQLNEWGIWADGRIEELEAEVSKLRKAIEKADEILRFL